jgi:uncharacterized delta-60 repeat protein
VSARLRIGAALALLLALGACVAGARADAGPAPPAPSGDVVGAGAIQPDGKALLVGRGWGDGNAIVLRYGLDGRLDRTFANAGRFAFRGGFRNPGFDAVAVQPDGGIVAGGAETWYATTDALFLVRLRADGRLDPGFGRGGVVATESYHRYPYYSPSVVAIAILPDGRIAVVITQDAGAHDVLVRYRADGSLDTSFGAGAGCRSRSPSSGTPRRRTARWRSSPTARSCSPGAIARARGSSPGSCPTGRSTPASLPAGC